MLRKLLPAAAAIALLTGTAAAQVPMTFPTQSDKTKSSKEIEYQKYLDKAYKAASEKVPEKKIDDPWAVVRPTPNAPTASKNKQ